MSLSAIAALALQVGPAAIRGISSLFGGNSTVDKVADAVEFAHQEFSTTEAKQASVSYVLESFTPEQQLELETLRVQLEKELTERAKIAAQDRQAEQHETQDTIRKGDTATDKVVRWSRPLMALVSCGSASYYLITTESPDLAVASLLLGLAVTYMGLRHREKDKGLTQ
ncbi:hypothetical protein [Vibrio sp. STUT-A11]|uniref:hypothetical protein n=1 Tax=Vibrio sp. STUT-A11 TaxID=2976236 RepID=UPI0022324367|nr:hypothetical protein [Vibrio sp. STUT-A11]BDR12911.1 hypothetical protein VspSTUT11_08870 [Vibrio sp. STUT-A11]